MRGMQWRRGCLKITQYDGLRERSWASHLTGMKFIAGDKAYRDEGLEDVLVGERDPLFWVSFHGANRSGTRVSSSYAIMNQHSLVEILPELK